MGVIQRQSIKHSIIQYIGIALGFMATLYVYPGEIATEAYGLVQAMIAAAAFTAPLVSLGTFMLTVKYFPVFKNDKKQHNGFLGLMLLLLTFGCFLYFLTFPYVEEPLLEFFKKKESSWYNDFFPFVLPLTFLILFARFLSLYASNFGRIVIPSILEEFLIKLTLPILIILYLYEIISINWVVYGVLINYFVASLGLLIYLFFLGKLYLKPDFTLLNKERAREMTSFAGYGILNGMGTKGAFYVDTLMVSALLDLRSTGIYSLINFIADTMSKPMKSIVGISQPIIAKSIANRDYGEVEKIYKKSSILLIIAGAFIFCGIWSCIDPLFSIMTNPGLIQAKYALFFLCLAKFINMATSVNNEIINYSSHYRFNFYTLLFLAAINITLNILLIPQYHLLGAALATFTSFAIFNFAKVTFIQIKFGFHPFSKKTLIPMVLGIVLFGLTLLLPDLGNPYFNIIMRAVLIGLLYPVSIFKMNISEDFNKLITDTLTKFAPFLLKVFK